MIFGRAVYSTSEMISLCLNSSKHTVVHAFDIKFEEIKINFLKSSICKSAFTDSVVEKVELLRMKKLLFTHETNNLT